MAWPLLLSRYGFQVGMLGGHLAEAGVKRALRKRGRGLRELAAPLGFAGAQVGISELIGYEEEPEWEEWPETYRVQGFNPQTWGRNREDSYGMGYR